LEGKHHAWGYWGGAEELHPLTDRKIPLPREEQQSLQKNVDKKKQQHFYDHIDPAYNAPFKNLNLAKCILSYRRMHGKRFPIVRSLQSITHISTEA
jgi:hypothetical protein